LKPEFFSRFVGPKRKQRSESNEPEANDLRHRGEMPGKKIAEIAATRLARLKVKAETDAKNQSW